MREVRICIDVDRDALARAVGFYRDALGLTVGRRLGIYWVETLGASAAIDLLGTRPGSRWSPAIASGRRDFARHWTPVHLDFVVEDLEAAIARATACGATLDREVQERPYGRMANMADPFGHGLCLIEWSAAGYDALLTTPEDLAEDGST